MNSLSALSAKSGKKNGIKSKPSFCIRTRHSSGGTRHSPKHSKIIADPHKYSHVTTIFCWLSHHSWWLNPHCWWLNPHVWTLESYFVMVASPFWDIFGACHHHVITMSSPWSMAQPPRFSCTCPQLGSGSSTPRDPRPPWADAETWGVPKSGNPKTIAGWWYTYPSEKYESQYESQWGWDDIPYIYIYPYIWNGK